VVNKSKNKTKKPIKGNMKLANVSSGTQRCLFKLNSQKEAMGLIYETLILLPSLFICFAKLPSICIRVVLGTIQQPKKKLFFNTRLRGGLVLINLCM